MYGITSNRKPATPARDFCESTLNARVAFSGVFLQYHIKPQARNIGAGDSNTEIFIAQTLILIRKE